MMNFAPALYIISTPIGNLEDFTIRSINVLIKSNLILCEDTRRSIKLLNHYKIKNKLNFFNLLLRIGVEPIRLATLEPKSSASTNFATQAHLLV